MAFKIMSIKAPSGIKSAWTLLEMMVALGIFSLGGLALMSLYVFSSRSFAAMANYAMLDISNRQAMDQLTREIREAKQVSDYTTNANMASITILTGGSNTHTVTYLFNRLNQQFVRNDATDGTHKMLLTNCSLLNFDLRQRNPMNGNFDIYPVATNNWQQTVKVIQLTWRTSMTLPNGVGNSENIQTARIVIRKQQD